MEIPDFLIVGAAKSGTSSLNNYLLEHPQICMPEGLKELNFWHTYNHCDERAILNFRNIVFPTTIEAYKERFSHQKPNQICGEASPSYLIYYKDTVENLMALRKDWSDVKIIIILREPIDKIWSHYKFSRNMKLDPENLSLPDALRREPERIKDLSLLPDLFFINNTKYYNQVKYYLDRFNHVKIILYDELKANPQSVNNQLTDFLGVKRFTPDNLEKVYNPSIKLVATNKNIDKLKGIGLGKFLPLSFKLWFFELFNKEEKMSSKTKKMLVNTFRPEIEKLNTIIDKDLSPWLKKYK